MEKDSRSEDKEVENTSQEGMDENFAPWAVR